MTKKETIKKQIETYLERLADGKYVNGTGPIKENKYHKMSMVKVLTSMGSRRTIQRAFTELIKDGVIELSTIENEDYVRLARKKIDLNDHSNAKKAVKKAHKKIDKAANKGTGKSLAAAFFQKFKGKFQFDVHYQLKDELRKSLSTFKNTTIKKRKVDLKKNFRYVTTIKADTIEQVFSRMQTENWSPKGEARELIASLGLVHTSMSVGDIVINVKTGEQWRVCPEGWHHINAPKKAKTTKKKADVLEGKRKPGVIAFIIKLLKDERHTKKALLEELTKQFPEREPEKMAKTINCQVPYRLRKDKGLIVDKSEKGFKIV